MQEIKHLLGQKIKDMRTRLGLSQQQLAEMINIDQRNLSNIECGNTFPTKSLPDIANALNITLPELFDFNYLAQNAEEMKKYIAQNIYNLEDDKVQILYRFMKSMR